MAQSTQWQLLLHSRSDQPQINHPAFLLSAANFSALAELTATLAFYQQDPVAAFCRFPARITYLANAGHLVLAADRFEHCEDLQQYRQQVPFDQLQLVYASEVLSSASSMMGHIFLTASGTNFRQQPVKHSLAYFTEITTLNPLRLIYDGTIGGMPGFFIVRPFQQDLQQYQQREGRNVWQFHLKSTAAELELLRLHLWELRGVDITYFFQSFNCATLTLELLALLQPAILDEASLFVSPQDVVKAASKHQMIQSTAVATATDWWSRALGQQLSSRQKSAVLHYLQTTPGDTGPASLSLTEPLAAEYLQAAAYQLWLSGQLDAARYQQIQSAAPAQFLQLDLSQYKHPARTPQDSAFLLASGTVAGDSVSQLGWLAAGHLLSSDNRQYLAESELKIGYLLASLNHRQQRWQLDELTLYAVRSFTPSDLLTPAWSGELYLGWRQMAAVAPTDPSTLIDRGAAELSAGLGKTLQLQDDLQLYWLVGGGTAHRWPDSKLFMQAKAGFSLDLVFDSKLQTEYQRYSSRLSGQPGGAQWSATLSWFFSQDFSFQLNWQHHSVRSISAHRSSMTLLRYF